MKKRKQNAIRNAGINIGHGHIKLKTDGNEAKYASVVSKTRMAFEEMGNGPDTQRVEVDGVFYEVGEEASLTGSNLESKVVFSEWADSQLYRVLMQSVIDRLVEEHAGKWTVVLCLPVSHYKNAKYREMVKDMWFKSHKGKGGEIDIVAVKIIPEAMGAMWKHAMDENDEGETNLAEMKRKIVTTLDFGYFTTDWGTLKRMTMDHDKSDSVDFGMLRILSKTQELIQKRYRKTCDLVEVEMAMLGKWDITIKNDTLDVMAIVKEVVSEIGPDMMGHLKTKLGDLDSVILVAGGPSALFDGLVRETFPNADVYVIQDPQMADAVGCWLLAQSVTEFVLDVTCSLNLDQKLWPKSRGPLVT